MKRIAKVLSLLFMLLIVGGCKDLFTYENVHIEYLSGKHNIEIKIKKYGVIEAELDADTAPITVTNFLTLVKEGFYDGNRIHRSLTDFVIQGGKDDLSEKSTIKGEFDANGVSNDISHVRGVLSMARMGDASNGFDTASTEFFIVQKDSTFLDHYYAGFGHVTKGIEVVDKIVKSIKNVDEDGMIINEDDMPVIEYIKEIEEQG